MSIEAILEFVILPCIGWLLMKSDRNEKRLTRIETKLDILLPESVVRAHQRRMSNE